MICSAARCFRLANDLRSDAREREEGKLNGVSLLLREFMIEEPGDSQALERAASGRPSRGSCGKTSNQTTRRRQWKRAKSNTR